MKKLISSLLLTIMLLTQFNFIAFINPINVVMATEDNVGQVENNHYKYYYNQLSDNSKKMYDAMQNMYNQGMLKDGKTNLDLIEAGYVSEELVNNYVKGSNDLIIAFETARDAFYLDYPEVFYINFDRYSIRITQDANKKYHLYLGTGNNESYMIHGFSSKSEIEAAEVSYNEAINKIVEEANKLETIKDKIKYVHDAVIASATYKLDDVCKEENRGHIRTPYGALIAHEAVCEGYSKSVKIALDKLGIPCILVRGTYAHDGITEGHMYNYVKLEEDGQEKWYAIDSTFDDYEGNYSYYDYFLAGYSTMTEEHTTNGIMSAPEFEFKYPDLEYEDYDTKTAYDYNGLKVNYTLSYGETDDNYQWIGGKFILSYKGMGIDKAKDNGYYLLVRYCYNENEYEDSDTSNWFYMESLKDEYGIYYNVLDRTSEDHTSFVLSATPYMQFAVTDVEYTLPFTNGVNQYYHGSKDQIIAQSDIIDNADGYYKPSPNLVSATPYNCTKLKPGVKTHITLTYSDKLEVVEGEVPGINLTCNAETSSGIEESKVENFGYEGNKVWFDFTPSSMWGDNSVLYYFNIVGLQGKWSKKTPRCATYYVQETFGCTYSMAQSKSWRIFGRPTLIDNGNLDTTGWELSDGKVTEEQANVLNKLTDKMTLVVTPSTTEEKKEITNIIEGKAEQDKKDVKLLGTEMYDINLVLCNKNVLKTANGHKVTVYLGFPEGYGPESAGVTFKVYHVKTTNGNKEIEEIDCVVTPYGLLVTCDSFSPYLVAAVKSTEEDLTNTSRNVIISTSENGTFEGIENSIVTLKENESVKFTIKADNGYKIESLSIFGKENIEAVGKDAYEITVNYDDVLVENNIINANFIAKTVAQVEEANGETIAAKELEVAKIDNMQDEISASIGEKVVLAPNVTSSNGIDTYQWYKNDEEIKGQTNKVLVLDSISAEDEGTYSLVVTSTLDTMSKSVKSNSCKVITSYFEIILETSKDEVVPGKVFEVNCYIKNFKNVKDGIVALAGQLEFDKSLLEIYKENKEDDALIGKDGWDLSAFNDSNFKFVADIEDHIMNSQIFTLYLKVNENITEEKDLKIVVKNVSASGGNGILYPVSNSEKTIHVSMKEEDPYIKSEKYVVNDETKVITRILPGTTVADFNVNVDTNKTIVLLNKDGVTLTDTDRVTTGTKIKVGEDLEYTLVVTGDVDCDGLLSVNDLAVMKLHFIDKEKMDEISIIAADIDNNNTLTINDLAAIKLVLIGKDTLE